jgi:hypothetical protein
MDGWDTARGIVFMYLLKKDKRRAYDHIDEMEKQEKNKREQTGREIKHLMEQTGQGWAEPKEEPDA